jgi:hypothetical protein
MGLARHKITGRRKFHGMRATSSPCFVLPYPLQRSWRLQSGAFPISKVRQAHSLIHSTRKKAFRYNFLAGLPLHVLREAEAGSPIKAVCAAHNISTAPHGSLKSSQNSETFSVEKCMKTEVDPGKLVTSRNSDSVGQLFSFRYLQKGRLQIDAQPHLIP